MGREGAKQMSIFVFVNCEMADFCAAKCDTHRIHMPSNRKQ